MIVITDDATHHADSCESAFFVMVLNLVSIPLDRLD